MCDNDFPALPALAASGFLYSAGDTVTATAAGNGALFALFNPGSKGLPVRLMSARVTVAAATSVLLSALNADPALTAGKTPQNCDLSAGAPEATFEAATAPAPTVGNQLGAWQVGTQNDYELVSPGGIFIWPGRGVLVSTPAVDAVVSLVFLWCETPFG